MEEVINYKILAELNINIVAAILIYIITFIIVAIVLWSVDYTKFIKRENRTQFIITGIYVIAVLSITFLIGSLFISFSAMISSLM